MTNPTLTRARRNKDIDDLTNQNDRIQRQDDALTYRWGNWDRDQGVAVRQPDQGASDGSTHGLAQSLLDMVTQCAAAVARQIPSRVLGINGVIPRAVVATSSHRPRRSVEPAKTEHTSLMLPATLQTVATTLDWLGSVVVALVAGA